MINSVEAAAKILLRSKYTIALTGSGISAESGIPTFRGKDGLWSKYKPEELATPYAFARNPKLVWEWYSWRMKLIKEAKPNPAHITLAKLQNMRIIKTLITQNIDDLHERAGSRDIIKLHGDIFTVRCINCIFTQKLTNPPIEIPPKCPRCGAYLRPDVVWFGESLSPEIINKAFIEAEKADAILVIGTSGVVMPAGLIPKVVKDNGGKVIEINIEETVITSYADLFLKSKAGEILPKIFEKIMEIRRSRHV